MSTFFDIREFFVFQLILVVLLTGLNVVFYISQKREQPANKLSHINRVTIRGHPLIRQYFYQKPWEHMV